MSDLPPKAAALWDKCWAEDVWHAGYCYVMSIDGKFGIAFQLEVYPGDFRKNKVPSADTHIAVSFVEKTAKQLASIVDNQATVYFDDKVKDDVNVLARVTVFVPFEGDDVTTYKHCRLIPVAKRISDFPFYETITRLCQERWG